MSGTAKSFLIGIVMGVALLAIAPELSTLQVFGIIVSVLIIDRVGERFV